MSKPQNIAGTAFVIAALRTEENTASCPLYVDKIAELFLDAQIKQIAQNIAQASPPAKEMVKLRTKYFDDALSRQISLGDRQVVILGSGLDTRAVRYNLAGVSYFEIDDRATLELKAEVLKKNNIAANVRYIPGDYLKDDLVSLLQQNQFNFDLPTYLIWEGNTTLLAKADVISVLETIRDKFKHFRLSFDYMSDKVISRTTGEQYINDYMDRYESMYAPWITGFENIETLANSLKLKAIENFSTADLSKKYRPNCLSEANILNFYFVCTLEN